MAIYGFNGGDIERALGQRVSARRDLSAAMQRNPGFSPLWAPMAAKDLRTL
jgi:hypothetical protein